MIALVGLGAWLDPTVARAQATVAVELNKAKLAWDWTQGTGGAVQEFRVKCGAATGSYSLVRVLVDPAARVVLIKDAIGGPGKWFCVVTAANTYGESLPSNDVSFDAGAPPAGPVELKVQAQ